MDGKTKQWTGMVHLVDIHLFDHRVSTWADAAVVTGSGASVHGHGRARRNPADVDVPDIGHRLAAARALRDLAERLQELAAADEAAQRRRTFSPCRPGANAGTRTTPPP